MRTSLDCLPCIVKQAVQASRLVTDNEEKILIIMKKAFDKLSKVDLSLTPPEIVKEIHVVIREELNSYDPYFEIKQKSTKRALDLEEKVYSYIKNSDKPFFVALSFAIAGNILDFGMKTDLEEEIISKAFDKALEKVLEFDENIVLKLYNELEKAETILVLGDNCGEAIFDRILIENFPKDKKVYYAVKDSPIINDVTKKEAIESKIDQVATIVSNGENLPGTKIEKCNEEFKNLFYKADVVISKGQGNFETLNEIDRKVWFLFQMKCSVIAKHYNYEVGDWIVLEKE